jgi:hypothetical protein
LNSHPRQRKGRQRRRARERERMGERESERDREVSPEWCPGAGVPSQGHHL